MEVTGGEGQIVNFGAGFDTRYWNLTDQQLTVRTFVEVDFPNVNPTEMRTTTSPRNFSSINSIDWTKLIYPNLF